MVIISLPLCVSISHPINQRPMNSFPFKGLMLLLISLFFIGYAFNNGISTEKYKDEVRIHQLSDPTGLHPHCTSDAGATEIKKYIFQRLLEYDYNTLQLIPVLAKKLPEMEVIDDGKGMLITYELREGMTWDNGKPITAKDVEFSFKAVQNPKVDAPNIRPYVNFVTDIKLYPDNPLKLTMVCDKVYFLWDHTTGHDVIIVPKHIYDPERLSDKFTYAQIHNGDSQIIDSSENIAFGKYYNDIKFHREQDFIIGSGPYKFVKWNTNQNIILERKENWWGDKIEGENMYFAKGPKRIVYETINDLTSAVVALKAGRLDVLSGIRSGDWADLQESKKIQDNFNLCAPPALVYTFLGINVRVPKFKDKKTRQALAYLLDVEGINEKLFYGLVTRIVGSVLPSLKEDYNNNLPLYPFDIDQAKALLKEAGWEDTDGNGLVDKVINGKRVDFKITFTYNLGNDTRKNMGLIFQEDARKAGIEVEVKGIEWSVFLEKLKANKIEMWYGGWVFDPRPSDPKQLWHTSSYGGGSNYTGFGNAETDKLIEGIQNELDPIKRSVLYKRWQEILHDEVPYIFMFTGHHQIAIHKRFDSEHLGLSEIDPGFWAGGFQLAKGYSLEKE